MSAGPGERGEREYDFARATPPSFGDLPAGYARTLLARRNIDDPTDIAYYLVLSPRHHHPRADRGRRGRPMD